MTHPALIERITRSLAYMLRHQPERFDLELDRNGFGQLDDVVRALNEALGESVEVEDVEDAISTGDRPRYEITGDRIRALYGHSIEVEPGEPTKPPEFLYVGVERRDAERALRNGLRGGRRRFLHLALTPEEGREGGRRAGVEYDLLTVSALDAWEEGINFYDRKSLFLAEEVPTQFLERSGSFTDGYEREAATGGPRGGNGRGSRRGGGRGERSDREERGRGGPRRDRDRDRPRERVADRDDRGRERADRGRDRDRGRDEAPRERAREPRDDRSPRDGERGRRERSGGRSERPERSRERGDRGRGADRDRPRDGDRPRERAPQAPERSGRTQRPQRAPSSGGFGKGIFEESRSDPARSSPPEPRPRPTPEPREAPEPAAEKKKPSSGSSSFGAGL